MFKDKSLFAILILNGEEQVMRIEVTKNVQSEICNSFSSNYDSLVKQKSMIPFTGTYNPDEDEILFIPNFKISKDVIDAIENPIGVPAFRPNVEKIPEIIALFVGAKIYIKSRGTKYIIAFQKFRKDQYISKKGINLFHDKDTFEKDERYGITITNTVDCVYDDGTLIFDSYYFARQIFDLSEYFRVATDEDIEVFINHSKIQIVDSSLFKSIADSWIRRKIALIKDSKLFDNYSIKHIEKRAKTIGITLPCSNGKLCMPSDKQELKNILKVLDEEVYKGTFSDKILQTNSKKTLSI